MPEPFASAGADYLEQLLRAAINVPAAAADPASGRVVARLMVTLGAKGEDERLEPYLSCSPGRRSVYEVTCYETADRPASRVTDLAAGRAIRAAARFASARPDRTVAIVARDDTGDERCVLVAKGGTATYQFPPVPAADAAPAAPAADADPDEATAPAPEPDPREAAWADLTARLAALPTTDDVAAALADVLNGVTTDLRDRLGSLPTTDEVVGALREMLGGMTIELDATAIEDVIYAALDELPRATPGVAPVPPGPAGAHETNGSPTVGAARQAVTIDPEPVADEVFERQRERASPGSPPDEAPPVTYRRPSDRAVEEVLALLALSSRRH